MTCSLRTKPRIARLLTIDCISKSFDGFRATYWFLNTVWKSVPSDSSSITKRWLSVVSGRMTAGPFGDRMPLRASTFCMLRIKREWSGLSYSSNGPLPVGFTTPGTTLVCKYPASYAYSCRLLLFMSQDESLRACREPPAILPWPIWDPGNICSCGAIILLPVFLKSG